MWELDGNYIFLENYSLAKIDFVPGDELEIGRFETSNWLFIAKAREHDSFPLHQKALLNLLEKRILEKQK